MSGIMIPEKVFQKILVLGDGWQVQPVDYVEKESQVLIRIEETPALWKSELCPHCNVQSVSGYDHAPERRWRHLNVCQLQSEIVCALPRGQCRECTKVYTVRAPWEGRSRGLTQEFEAFALTLIRVFDQSLVTSSPTMNEMDTEKFKMGWLVVAFELPVGTKKQRKAATDFRNYLLDDGCQMMQFSVYVRACVSFARQETHIERLKKNLPPEGSVRAVFVTRAQWERSYVIQGAPATEAEPAQMPEQIQLW